MEAAYTIFAASTFAAVFLDSFFYPTFTLQHIHIDAIFMAFCFIVVTVLLRAPLIESVRRLHNKVIFPFISIVSFALLILEKMNYDNFVFTRFHIHPFLLIFIPVLSGIIIYSSRITVPAKYAWAFYAMPLFLLTIYVISSNFAPIFARIIKEDNILEYLQFLFYLIASFYSFGMYRVLSKRKKGAFLAIVFLILGIALFFTAGEEISWGQRLLGIHTPRALSTINAQDEITLHNLTPFQKRIALAYILVGLYGAFSRLIVEKIFRGYKNLAILTPPYFLSLCFFIVAFIYFQRTYSLYLYASLPGISRYLYPQHWEEVAETILAFGFFGYAYYTYRSLKS